MTNVTNKNWENPKYQLIKQKKTKNLLMNNPDAKIVPQVHTVDQWDSNFKVMPDQ